MCKLESRCRILIWVVTVATLTVVVSGKSRTYQENRRAIMGYGESGFRQPSGQYVYSFSDFVQEVTKRSKTSEAELSVLRKGTQLWKVRSYDKWFPRRYTLDENHLRICYEPTHKPICSQTDNYIDILDIQDVRSGWATDTFNRVGRRVEERKKKYPTDPILQESHCFSIIYGDGQTLDLVAGEEDIAKKWVRGLRHLLSVVRGLRQERLYEEWLKAQFRKADKDNTGSLNFEECLKLLSLLNIKMSKDHVRKLFNEANTNRKTVKREQVLDEQEFLSFYQQLLKRPEVEELFRKYATSNGSVMTATELLTFFRKEYQDENVSIENVQKLIQSFELSEIKSRDCLSLAGFTNLLTSGMFEVLRPEHSTVHQDMTRPLAHYYIASSHNTYLTGNQLTSESSIEAYINALRKGCRCLELDLWDGPNDEPSIYHGHTITSAILVKDVLADAIKTHAFDVSPYPVILSLENHLSPPQQDKLAKHLKEILGDMLYTDPVDENLTSLPSPETLKYKIIIKGKKMKSASVMPSAPAADLAENEEESRKLSHLQASGRQSLDYALMRIDEPDGNVQAKPPAEEKLKKIVSKDLSDLVNICQAVSFKSFAQSRADNKWYQMSSFSEGRAKELMETAWDDFVEHTSRQLVRIYPAGSRTGSSNYNPVPYWKVGCQIVALNYQTPGKDMMVARARFLENGNCGYVLKPDFLSGASNQTNSLTITIRIISGQSLPKAREEKKKDVVDPYVSVKLYGESEDQKFKTKHVPDNGFNPVWNETTTFHVASPETTMILFQVKDKDKISNNEFIGGYALPVASLSEGYSHVPLLTKNGDAISPATIFIHVKFVKS